MALFATPSSNNIDLLFATGFAARLRRPEGYLAVNDDNLCFVSSQATAAVLHFAGVRRAETTRATVHVAPKRYIDVEASSVTDDPVIVSVHTTPNERSIRIALSDVRTKPAFLTLPEPTAPGVDAGGREFFDLEIIAAPQADWKAPDTTNGEKTLSFPAAVLRAALSLALRFRIRSVHKRVLRLDGTRVRQDGPRTTPSEANEAEMLLEPTPTAAGEFYLLRAVTAEGEDEQYLAIRPGSDNSPHVVLIPKPEAEKANSGAQLSILPANQWGALHLGLPDAKGTEWLMAGRRGRLETRRHTGGWETYRMEYVIQTRDAALKEAPVLAAYNAAEKATTARARNRIAANIARASTKKTTTQSPSSGAKKSTAVAAAPLSSPASKKASAAAPSTSPIATASDVTTKKSAEEPKPFDHSRAIAALSLPDERTESADSSPASTPSPTSVQATGAQSLASPNGASAGASATTRTGKNRKLTKREKRNRRRRAQGVLPPTPKNCTPQASASAANTPRASCNAASTPRASSNASTPRTSENASTPRDKTATGVGADSTAAEAVSGTVTTSALTSSATSRTSTDTSGPPCGACGRPIVGEYTVVNGKNYHRGCLKCGTCSTVLGGTSGRLRMHDGLPRCERCYTERCASRCARCTQPILETVVTAMERTWHRECLTCVYCRNPLGEKFWVFAHKPREPHCNECMGVASAAENNRHRAMAPRPAGPLPTLDGGEMAGTAARMHMRPALPRRN